jgi:hypothetical protein
MSDVFNAQDPASKVDELVGEGKKFKSVDDLAKGKLEADAFIEQLKAEQAELRKQVETMQGSGQTELATLRAELAQLKAQGNKANPQGEHTAPQLSESDLKALVAKTITETEASKTAAQNVNLVNVEVLKVHGSVEKATEAVRAKARERNISVDALKAIAAQSPSAFFAIMGMDGTQTRNDSGALLTGSHIPTGQGEPKEGTKAYFDAIRKKNPSAYWKPAVQNRIFAAKKAGTYDN